MMSTRTRILPAIVMPVLLFLTACGVNSIPTAEENAKAKWADVQNYYQRRADLIPNLVATVAPPRPGADRAARGHRSAGQRHADHGRPRAAHRSGGDGAVRRGAAAGHPSLQRLQEAYPELHTNANYQTLMSQLEGTENRISTARHDYNRGGPGL